MALLTISAYKQYNNQGQQVLIMETTGNHGIEASYIDIAITGATDIKYNGTFKFSIKDDTTLEYREEVYTSEPILTQPTLVDGVIVANTVDYITLAPANLSPTADLYTITADGDYQISLDESKLYKIKYFPEKRLGIKVGERLNDTDRILYAEKSFKPISIYKSKWLILETEGFEEELEIRLITMN